MDDKYLKMVPALSAENVEKAKNVLLAVAPLVKQEALSARIGDGFFSDLKSVASWQDFQHTVLFADLMPAVLKSSVDGVSYNGLDNLDKNCKYLFVSNHRDISLDSMFIGYGLIKNGYSTIQPVLGLNLLKIPAFAAFFLLCGGVVIDRDLPPRELFDQSMLLSSYITDAVSSGYSSVWIAGGAGRSKDGTDVVKSSVMKMIMLSCRKTMTVADFINKVKIVPVTISYEYDPTAIMKSYAFTNENGNYSKSGIEDAVSVLKGIKGYKGRVAVNYCKPVEGDFSLAEDVSSFVQSKICSNYTLFPINYCMYDKIHDSSGFKSKYDSFDSLSFLRKISHMSPLLQRNIMKYYANPVEAMLAAKVL